MEFNKQEWKTIEEKCHKIKPEQIEEKFQEALLNDYVEEYRSGRLVYTKKFYQDMHAKIQSGKTYVQAYKALGFDVEALGEDRANAAGKRAEQMAEDGTLNKARIGDYRGDIPLKQMQDLKKMDLDGYMAYLEGRCIYLEAALDVEKEKKRYLYQVKK